MGGEGKNGGGGKREDGGRGATVLRLSGFTRGWGSRGMVGGGRHVGLRGVRLDRGRNSAARC